MKIEKIIDEINFPNTVKEDIINLLNNYDFSDLIKLFKKYVNGEYDVATQINKIINFERKKDIIWVCLYLYESLDTYKKYKEIGIDDKVFFETMKILRRNIIDNKEKKGYYHFDIEFWVHRQINLKIFRLGVLEYELTSSYEDIILDNNIVCKKEDKVITIHIPSDAEMTYDNLISSIKQIKEFVKKYFPDYEKSKIICTTWLLSIDLDSLLEQDSKIMIFKSLFKIYKSEKSNSYKTWVFGYDNIEPKNFPENTSLQRKIKKHILNNGEIKNSSGVLICKNI